MPTPLQRSLRVTIAPKNYTFSLPNFTFDRCIVLPLLDQKQRISPNFEYLGLTQPLPSLISSKLWEWTNDVLFHIKCHLDRCIESHPLDPRNSNFTNFGKFGTPMPTPVLIRAKFGTRRSTFGLLFHAKFRVDWYMVSEIWPNFEFIGFCIPALHWYSQTWLAIVNERCTLLRQISPWSMYRVAPEGKINLTVFSTSAFCGGATQRRKQSWLRVDSYKTYPKIQRRQNCFWTGTT